MGDLINRQDAIRLAEQGQIQGFQWQFKKLCELPSAEPDPEWRKKHYEMSYNQGFVDACKYYENLPERKKGKWIATYSDCGGDVWVSWKCSNCGYVRKKRMEVYR